MKKDNRLRVMNKDLAEALEHCNNVLEEYERNPQYDTEGFMLGALDLARKTLKEYKENINA